MIHLISLGAGVQSSTMALMAAAGEIGPMPTAAIFADTGWEPAEVYEWLERLKGWLPFPLHVVSHHGPPLREFTLRATMRDTRRYMPIPVYTAPSGMADRQCTRDWAGSPGQHVAVCRVRGGVRGLIESGSGEPMGARGDRRSRGRARRADRDLHAPGRRRSLTIEPVARRLW